MKILIADDDAVSRRLLQAYLEKWGHEVVVTTNGAEAWSAFQQGDVSIVISDWMMPELTGPELIRRIRAEPRPGYVYAILVTAKAQKEDVVEGMEAGADDFVSKPFDRDELHVRLRAGERILTLERTLTEQAQELDTARAALGQGSPPTEPEGRAPPVEGIRAALERVAGELAASRGLLSGESVPAPQLEAARRLLDAAVDGVREARESLTPSGSAASPPPPGTSPGSGR